MPSLKDLAKNLKDFNYYSGKGNFTQDKLSYGSDKLSGQKSSQPFIVTPNGFRWSPSNFDEGFVQFGAVSLATRTQADALRIGKFLTTTIQGPLFLVKQAGLQKANVEIEHDKQQLKTDKPQTGQGVFNNVGNTIANTANKISNDFGPTRIYNPLGINTLAQIEGNLLGIHYMRHGLTPKQSGTKDYENYILKKDKGDSVGNSQNRLYLLANELSLENSEKSTQGYLLRYKGGPGSLYGIGETTIKRYSNFLLNKNKETNDSGLFSKEKGFVSIPIANLVRIKYNGPSQARIPSIPDGPDASGNNGELSSTDDFRQYKNKLIDDGVSTGQKLAATDYKKYNLESRIGVARNREQGNREQGNRVDYTSNPGNYDTVNRIATYYSSTPNAEGAVDFYGKKITYNPDPRDPENVSIRDMIKFRIKSIDNDNPSFGHYIVFRAYIDSLRRNMTANWKDYSYVGRGENFYLYDGFVDSIDIGFTIAASSRIEMQPLYQKLNFLMSTLTPDYYNNKMRGNISELTIGNFLAYQPGVITNLTMTVPEEANWEIAIDEVDVNGANPDSKQKDNDMQELPHMLKCTMTFKPIYNFLPRKSTYKSPFIGIDYYGEIKEGQKWLQKGAKYEQKVEKLRTGIEPEEYKK